MIFLNDKHELRSGWKFAAYIAFFLLIGLAMSVALSIAPVEDQLAVLGLNEFALLAPAIGAMLLTVRFVDHRPLRAFGIGLLPRWRRDLFFGLGIAAGMLAVLIAGCYLLGFVSIRWTAGQVPATTLSATFGLLLMAALNEELVFRGFPLQLLVEGIGEWPAMIAMSILFGALHRNNPNVSALSTFNTIVAGILLSLAYVRTRSLWLPYAIHVGWNVGMGFVFGFPLSGIDIASLWTTGTAGSETILGGDYGPEGGILATFIFAASAVIVERYGSINPTQAPVGGRSRWHHRNRAGDS